MADGDGFDSDGAGSKIDLQAYIYLALMVLIGSCTAPAAKFAVRELPAGFLPLIRFGVAGLCLLPIVGRRGGNLGELFRTDFWRLALAAALCIPVNQTFFLNGARLAPTSHIALIYASCPLFVLLMSLALGQERLVASRLAGIIASMSGVVVIGLDSFLRGGAGGHETLQGDLLLLGAVSSWGAYLTVSKPLIARHGPLTVLAGTFLVGTALHVPVALATMPGWAPLSNASGTAWRGLFVLTMVVTLVGLTFQNLAMKRLDASQVASFGNAAPLLTVVWGVWLFGETLTPALIVGGALTLGGILWTSRAPRTRDARNADEVPVIATDFERFASVPPR